MALALGQATHHHCSTLSGVVDQHPITQPYRFALMAHFLKILWVIRL